MAAAAAARNSLGVIFVVVGLDTALSDLVSRDSWLQHSSLMRLIREALSEIGDNVPDSNEHSPLVVGDRSRSAKSSARDYFHHVAE